MYERLILSVTKDKKVFESLWYWSLPSHPIRKFEKCNANQGGTMETKASWWRRSQVKERRREKGIPEGIVLL
uniref:Uncharacterized protein n=1 Tax=Populus trichocarpa TaxID=3694 RepID=A0A2K2B113_POPTR